MYLYYFPETIQSVCVCVACTNSGSATKKDGKYTGNVELFNATDI